ncbi:MAG: 3-methylcrotonyl-CoA carboxylase, partial [Pseudomonadales bacterium]|nr:3-methylcrotonyl-CoA carboxylase [Pseudomonadales bacterium]
AEDPANQFMPQTGPVHRWITPQDRNTNSDARIDHGIQQGSDVSPFYDPMLAKIIVWGKDRQEAIRKLRRAIEDTVLFGVHTNKWFLQNIISHPHFIAGDATTAFIQEQFAEDESLSPYQPSTQELALAGALFHHQTGASSTQQRNRLKGWHSSNSLSRPITFALGDNKAKLELSPTENTNEYSIVGINAETHNISITDTNNGFATYVFNGVKYNSAYLIQDNTVYIDTGKHSLGLTEITHEPPASSDSAGSGRIIAPMDGSVIDILCQEGDTVSSGQTLAVVEAMKMEHQIKADCDGLVSNVSAVIGDQVKNRQLLIQIETPTED